MKLTCIFTISFIFWKQVFASDNYDGLLKYLNEDSKVHRVVFLVEKFQNSDNPVMNSLMKAVNSQFPSLTMIYNKIGYLSKDLDIITESSTANLIILQWSESTLKFNLQLVIHQLMGNHYASKIKILIVAPFLKNVEKSLIYLTYFYGIGILDVTLLTNKNFFIYDKKLIRNKGSDISLQLIQYNLFTDNYSVHELSPKSKWFPNKLQDLNKYKMYFSCNNYYRWDNADLINVKKLLNIVKKKMNIEPILSLDASCKDRVVCGKTEGELKEIGLDSFIVGDYSSRSDLVLHPVEYSGNDVIEMRNEKPQIIRLTSTKAVIPLNVKITKNVETSKELWYMILITIGTIAIIRFMVIVLKFNSNSWQTLSISQIIMGMSTNQEPVNWKERIVFGSFLLGCIVYTNYFFSVILDLNFQTTEEISTFEELIKSSLIPKTHARVAMELQENYKDFNISEWLNYDRSFSSSKDCLKYLSKHKNISCIIRDADRVVNEYKSKYGEINFKILPETLEYSAITFNYKLNSPYFDRFNRIISSAVQYGLLEDFYDPHVPPERDISKPEMLAKEQIMLVIIYVLGIGYSLAFIVFILEILSAKFKSQLLNKH